MKHLKTALALSAVLAGVGSAQAATYTYDVGVQSLITGLAIGYGSSTDSTPGTDPGPAAPGSFPLIGTATYDDVAGTLGMTYSYAVYIQSPSSAVGNYTVTSSLAYTGTPGAGTFTTTAGTGMNVACVNGTAVCPANLNLGVPFALSATPVSGNGGGLLEQPFNVAGGTNTWTLKGFNGFLTTAYTMDFTPTSVIPVPAAAWLFGSALAGLAGAARRRRHAA